MLWVFFALLAHVCWGMVNVTDKYILEKHIRNPYVYIVWLSLLGIFGAIILFPFIDFSFPSFQYTLLLFAASICYFFGGFPYIKAMSMEEASRINIWWGLIPIFSLFFSFIFVGQRFSQNEYIGFVFLMLGAVFASVHLKKSAVSFSRAVWYMALAGVSFALYAVIFDYVTRRVPFTIAYILVTIFSFCFAFSTLSFPKFRQQFFDHLYALKRKPRYVIVINSFFEQLGIFFNQWAIFLGVAALVFAMEGFQFLFVFGLTSGFSLFFPSIIKEQINFGNVVMKILALLSMVFGILFVV